MAINTLEFAKLMMTQLDQHANIGATSGWMEANSGQVIYHGGDEVKIPTMSTVGLADYDRDNGFVQGGVSLKYDTYKMTQDRARTFQLDSMDVDESNFIATAANVIKIFQTENVIPEIDSYRYSKIASIAESEGRTEGVAITQENVLTKIREHIRAIQDVVGIDQQLIITLPTNILAALEDSPKISKSINVGEFRQGQLNFQVKKLDDHILRVAPSARLKTAYDVQDGSTGGQENGGLKPATNAKDINWIITPASVPIAISKTDKIRVFSPDENQKADAWKIDFRKYHDLWIKKQKVNQIMVCTTV